MLLPIQIPEPIISGIQMFKKFACPVFDTPLQSYYVWDDNLIIEIQQLRNSFLSDNILFKNGETNVLS